MTSRELLLDILAARRAARPAVLCPGGMMSMAVTALMTPEAGWPRAHADEDAMVALALAMQQASGFDNLALPFCMTLEAESYGARIDFGDRLTQPRVSRPLFTFAADRPPPAPAHLPVPDFSTGRPATVLRAMRRLKAARPDVALIGNLNGPFSILGELGNLPQLLRWTRKAPDPVRALLDRLTSDLLALGRAQIAAGADVLCIAEPSATGEILGGALFRAFVLPCLNRLAADLRAAGAPLIVHICGDVRRLQPELLDLAADALSFDSGVDLPALVARRPPWQVMGNVSPFLLETGPVESIARLCRRLIAGGVRLVAPACGIVPTTPPAHLRAMCEAVAQ